MDIAVLPDHLTRFLRSRHPEPPLHLGRRYNRDGVFLSEPGNTIVCHVAPDTETERVLRWARNRYLAMEEARKLAFTAEASLHMTVFQGIIEYRRRAPYWPDDLAHDTPIEDMTALYRQRLSGFGPGPAFKVVLAHATPNGLTLEAASEADRRALGAWRDRFADILGYRHPDHDDYRFHITFCYLIERFDEAEMSRWRAMLSEVETEIRARAPVLELKAPAFCAFEDMHHFEELVTFAVA